LNIQLSPNRSAFLWGPRKTGKTFWINTHLSDSPLIDLLKTDIFSDFGRYAPGIQNTALAKSKKRRLIETEKFYLFDVGLTNYLARRSPKMGTPEFGHSFENYILMELKAYQAYRNPELDIRYWRTSTGFEVDFILGDLNVAIEAKGSSRVHSAHTRGLRALLEEHQVGKAIIVALEKHPRMLESGVEVLPWQDFLETLWAGELGV